jgi:hypothetical protein
MSSFRPYFDRGCRHPSARSVAYVRVRAPNEPGVNGSVTVFLTSGTAMQVPANDVLRLDPRSEVDTSMHCGARVFQEHGDV